MCRECDFDVAYSLTSPVGRAVAGTRDRFRAALQVGVGGEGGGGLGALGGVRGLCVALAWQYNQHLYGYDREDWPGG
jgi:hypothetical protein